MHDCASDSCKVNSSLVFAEKVPVHNNRSMIPGSARPWKP